MLNRTMSSHKKMFLRWHDVTDNDKKVGKCKRTIDLFSTINAKLSESLNGSLFESIGEHKRRMEALNKIIFTH